MSCLLEERRASQADYYPVRRSQKLKGKGTEEIGIVIYLFIILNYLATDPSEKKKGQAVRRWLT